MLSDGLDEMDRAQMGLTANPDVQIAVGLATTVAEATMRKDLMALAAGEHDSFPRYRLPKLFCRKNL